MPQADLELFTLGATTPESGVAHGSAMTQAGLHAGAEFRRGVRLGASFQLAAEAQGALGSALAAQVTAGVSAKAAVSLDVGFPLDLFDQAGIVARFRAQAEAAAYLRVRVALSASELASLTEALLPPAVRPMHRAFLDEVDVGAGFWARAAFAAQIQAEAVLAGSLLPGAPGGPGFSMSVGYGVGLGAAVGKAFVANVGLRNPRRLLDRLATELSALIVAEAERAIDQLDDDDREPARRALAVTRILVPLATRTAFSLGLDLALASSADERAKATESVVGSFVNEAQRVLLDGATELALRALADAIGRDTLVGAFLADEARRTAAAAQLRELDARLASLEHVPPGDPKAWLAAVTALAAPIDALVGLGGPAAAEADALRAALARLWAAAVLLDRVLGWADNSARGVADLFGATPVVATGAESIAARIGASVGKPAGVPLHLSDLVSFVTGQDLEAELRARVPAVAPALDWLATASGAASGQIVQRLLVDLAAPDQQSLDAVLQKLGQAAAQVVNAEVVPRVLRPIKDQNPDDEALHLVIDRMATPLLVALPIVVVPGLAKLGDPEGSKRLREALSAVLLQILNRFLMATTDVVFQRALDVGEDALRALGNEVEQVGEAYPAFGVVSAVASRSIIPVSIVPQDVAAVLDIAAGMTEIINRTQRQPVIALIGSALELGLGDDATRAQVAAGLLDTDDRIRPEDTDRLLVQMRSGAWELVRYTAPRILDLLMDILLREIRLIAELIEAGAKAVVAAAKAAIAAAAALLAQLEAELRRLAQEALRLLAQISSRVQDVVTRVAAIQAAALARIKAAGRTLLDQLLAALPGWTAWAHDEIRVLYGIAFDALAWALSAPLQLVASVAGWINQAALDGLRWASYDGPAIRQAIRDRVAASGASDLQFDLAVYAFGERIGPPKFTIQAGTVLQRVADAVLDDPIVKAVIDAVAADAVSVQAVRAQEATLAAAKANQGTPPDPKTIVPGAPVAVAISGVANGGQASGPVPLRIRVAGANRSFVQTTLGVPPRVTLRVNGQRWNVDPADWVEVNGGIEPAATVVPVATAEAAPSPAPTIHAGSLVRETELVAIADRMRGDIVVGKLDKATRVWDGVAVRRGVEDIVRLVEPLRVPDVPIVAVPERPLPAPDTVRPAPTRPKPIRTVPDRLRPVTIDQPAAAQPQILPAPVTTVRTGSTSIAFADVAGLTATAEYRADRTAFTFTARDTVQRLPIEAIRHVQLATEAQDVAPSRVEAVATTATAFRAPAALLPTLDERTLLAIAAEPTVTGTVVAGLPGVNVVQVAVADGENRVAHGRLLFHLVERQPGIEVADVVLDGRSRVERERVVLRSTGTVPIDLEGWTLRDAGGNVFTFPRVTLQPGARLTVHTGRGRNTKASLYWGRGTALWRQEGAMAIVHDASGKEMARRVVTPDPGPAR